MNNRTTDFMFVGHLPLTISCDDQLMTNAA